jgi:hypothetical protein
MKLTKKQKEFAVIAQCNRMALEEIQEFADFALRSDDTGAIATCFGQIASKASVETERLLGEQAGKDLVAAMILDQKSEQIEAHEEVARPIVEVVTRKIASKVKDNKIKQFNFSRHWKKRIVPILNEPDVRLALHLGMAGIDSQYEFGDPPWRLGRGPLNGQRAKSGCLSWYQPWGRCHDIAPFVWAIGKELYPELNWGFISGRLHTVVVGYKDDFNRPEYVMDILYFKRMTANESLNFAKISPNHMPNAGWGFHPTLRHYLATFSDDHEKTFQQLSCIEI